MSIEVGSCALEVLFRVCEFLIASSAYTNMNSGVFINGFIKTFIPIGLFGLRVLPAADPTATVLNHLAGTSRDILISLVKALDASTSANKNQQLADEIASAGEELEDSEFISEPTLDPSLAKTING